METRDQVKIFRLPLGLKVWLRDHARSRGLSANTVAILALERYRQFIEGKENGQTQQKVRLD
jgi:hypothetical protein